MAYDDLDSGNMHWFFSGAFKLDWEMIQCFFYQIRLNSSKSFYSEWIDPLAQVDFSN